MRVGSSYGTLNTVSGERLQIVMGPGAVQMVVTRARGGEVRLRLALSEARRLSNLLREAVEVEEGLLESTHSG